jgi:hypothetical protein
MTGEPTGPRPKVSVVVPVHDPGPSLERSIASLDAQTMPADAFEAIFVDDGSSDGSGARLDALAAERSNVRVVHIPASGSPGLPRNVGLDMALGEYVQFLDADDRLGERALERQYDVAARNRSDIVVGKLVSNFRGVSWSLFRANREACTLRDAPLIANLTVSKMFRAAFLREHGLRFPEGWPKIEDEHLVVRAYLRASTVSVIADEACYFYCERADGGNLSSQPLDPDQYFEHLGSIFDEIERGTAAGAFRARLLRRFYQVEMLGRLTGDPFVVAPADDRERLVAAVRRLSLARLDDRVHDGLPPALRLRSTLLRLGGTAELEELARREATLALHVVAGPVRRAPGGFEVPWRASPRWSDGSPFLLVRAGGRLVLDPRLTDGLGAESADVAVDPHSLETEVGLDERGGWLEWLLQARGRVRLNRPTSTPGRTSAGKARIPVAGGVLVVRPDAPGPSMQALTAGSWDVIVRLNGLGLDLRAAALAEASEPPARDVAWVVGDPVGVVVPALGSGGEISLEVRAAADLEAPMPGRVPPSLVSRSPRVAIHVPLAMAPQTRGRARLALGSAADNVGPGLETLETRLTPRGAGTILTVVQPAPARVAPGPYPLWLAVAGAGVVRLGTATVGDGGRISVEGLRRMTVVDRARLGCAGAAISARGVARRGGAAAERVSADWRRGRRWLRRRLAPR